MGCAEWGANIALTEEMKEDYMKEEAFGFKSEKSWAGQVAWRCFSVGVDSGRNQS